VLQVGLYDLRPFSVLRDTQDFRSKADSHLTIL
jgi:hypothetical protein